MNETELIGTLRKLQEAEKSLPNVGWSSIGWNWLQVGLPPARIVSLVLRGYVAITYSSSSRRLYRLTDKAFEALRASETEAELVPQELEEELPDLSKAFDDIIGYDDVKDLLKAIISMDTPFHALLAGPPAIAKTMFLWGVERVTGVHSLWVLGSALSKAGLWDALAERRPRYLLVDELEKMPYADMAGLLSLMEGGRLVRVKVNRALHLKLDCSVIAVCNEMGLLPPELLSRFAVKKLSPYSKDEYVAVVEHILTRREGIPAGAAQDIALAMRNRTQDVRQAVRAARLAKHVGVERALELLE